MATDSKPGTRRDLLRAGAYASEFAGRLYRDVCVPELANYWRDRAIEWAPFARLRALVLRILVHGDPVLRAINLNEPCPACETAHCVA